MPRPLLGGGGGRSVARPVGGQGYGVRLLLSQGRQRRHVPNSNKFSFSDQQWNVVIQYSARHLFCPAHASTATTAAATTMMAKGVRATVIDTIRHSARKQLIFARRQLSSATALASDPPHASSSFSQGTVQDRPHNNQGLRDQGAQEEVAASPPKPRRSRSASNQIVRSGDPGSEILKADISGSPTLDIDSPSSSSGTATSPKKRSNTKTAVSPPSADSTKHDYSTSWNFPSPNRTRRRMDTKPTDTTRYWALAEFYNAMHQLQSSTVKDSSRSSILRAALSHYNYLSHQQSLHDKPLIPRKEARSLFVLQSRETKTRHNLEQLLRIAADLIWLNEKDRQLKRRNNSRVIGKSDKSSDMTLDPPYIHNQANNFHGLRVSEYTILMNWIGSVPSITESSTTGASPTMSASSSSILSNSSRAPNVLTVSPADRVWGIWHDFLLTGMSPDVVLYTAVIGVLLKANEYDRVNQIWQHMHRRLDHQNQDQDRNSGRQRRKKDTVEDMDPVSKTLSHGTSTSLLSPSPSSSPLLSTVCNVDDGLKGRRKSNAIDLLDSESQRPHNWRSITPNIQTYSVLMQTHVLKRDIQGVAQTYKEFLQSTALPPPSTSASKSMNVASTSEKQQQHHGTRANTVFLNQILTALVNLGENNAAKEIYAAMRLDRDQAHSTSATANDIDNAEEERRDEERTLTKQVELSKSGGEVGSTVNDKHTSRSTLLSTSSISSSLPLPLPLPLPSLSPSVPGTISSFLTSSTLASSNSSPVHHRNSERRSTWLKRVVHEARKSQSSVFKGEGKSPSSSTLLSSIQPDNTTRKLILKMARRKNDTALEEIVLKDMDSDFVT